MKHEHQVMSYNSAFYLSCDSELRARNDITWVFTTLVSMSPIPSGRETLKYRWTLYWNLFTRVHQARKVRARGGMGSLRDLPKRPKGKNEQERLLQHGFFTPLLSKHYRCDSDRWSYAIVMTSSAVIDIHRFIVHRLSRRRVKECQSGWQQQKSCVWC